MANGGRGGWRLDGLGMRLVVLLGIALLPIGLIAITQTFRMLNEVEARTKAALLGETLDAAERERELLLSSIGASRVLAGLGPALLEAPENCSEIFRRVRDELSGATFAGLIRSDGILACASEGEGFDVSESASFQNYIANPGDSLTLLSTPALSETPIIVVRRPVTDPDSDTVLGFVALALPLSAFTAQSRSYGGFAPIDIITFASDGEILNAQSGLEKVADRVPSNTALKALAGAKAIFQDIDSMGRPHVYTVTPLLQDRVHVLAIWPPQVLGFSDWGRSSAVAFPLMMWFASLAVAYFAVHTLVIRHIRALRRRIRGFSTSRRIDDDGPLEEMPAELREVTEAFQSMTGRILRDEADLENSLHEKDVLLKEVHHRVKNNLQLIASMTNMQMRKTRDPKTRSILRRLQDRVLGMAAVHRSLYETTSLSMVRADNVLREVSGQLAQTTIPAGSGIRFNSHFDKVNLYPDQALPLSLLLTEAMTNAVKYLGRPPDGRPYVRVSLSTPKDDQVCLVIENSLGERMADLEDMDSSGLGSQLIQAFIMQLGATARTEEADTFHRLTIRFKRSDFEAEDIAPAAAGKPRDAGIDGAHPA